MSEPALAPRNAFLGVAVVWAVALAAAVAVGIFATEDWRMPWLVVSFGVIVLLSFAVQLAYGQAQGFLMRVASTALGALLLMGVISVGFGLTALVPA